jgi:hypothetical protein
MPKFNQGSGPSKAVSKTTKVPVIIEPKCLVCKSPHRHLVDQMLVAGMTYSEIERQFEFAGLKRRSIASHKERHLGYEEAAIRAVIEREADLARRNYEEGVDRLVTKKSYLEVALQKAYDALIKDETIVEPKDAVKVIETLSKMQSESEGIAIDELNVQLQAFMQAVREVVPNEYWQEVVKRTHELLKGSGHDAPIEDTKTLEAAPDGAQT